MFGSRSVVARRTTLVVGLAFGLTAAACGAGSDGATPADPGTAAAPPTSTGSDTLTIAIPTTDGGQIDFGSLEGQDVVLWFWAPW